jgi:hypothetical protein
MTLTTSYNKSKSGFLTLYLWTLRRHVGVAVLYAVLLFLALPLALWLFLSSQDHYAPMTSYWMDSSELYYESMRNLLGIVVVPVTLLFTLIIACMMFRYLFKKRSVDLYYAWPVSRPQMFLARYFAGLTLILVPLAVMCGLALLVPALCGFVPYDCSGIGFGGYALKNINQVIGQMFWLLLAVCACYSFCTFSAVCSGTMMDMVISILAINVSYPVVVALGAQLMSDLLCGFSVYTLPPLLLTALSPFGCAFVPYSTRPDTPFLLYWIVFSIAVFAGAYLLYRRRRSELAENTVAHSAPTAVIRFLATLGAAVGLGLLFSNLGGSPDLMFWAGALIGAFVANLVLEYVYARSFKRFVRSLIPCGATVLCLAVFYLALCTGGLGYSAQVPDPSAVQSVVLTGPQFTQGKESLQYYSEMNSVKIQEEANISKVTDLHRRVLTKLGQTRWPRYRFNEGTITYHLKNGRTLTRTYYEDDGRVMGNTPEMDALTDSEEYVRQFSSVFQAHPENLVNICVRESDADDPVYWNLTAEEKASFASAFKQDLLSDTSARRAEWRRESHSSPQIFLSFDCDHGRKITSEAWKLPGYYENTLNLIKEKGWMKDSPKPGEQPNA